ncbi:ABC transporter substrate-binding protein [Consotaella aegiceratis]|uniref:ABC transporter substrate-binding protein n=1 Tax=Consotaella aegiceratis TaxID=3097961 RepID=UPI002F428C56
MMTRTQTLFATSLAALLMSSALANAQLRMWTTEEQPDRLAKQEELAAEFEKKTGTAVEVIPVTESELGTRATAAFAAGDLPDIIYHPQQHALPWAEAGILDVEAANQIVEDLGRDTFAPGALAFADFEGETASVPVDGWTQMVLYRSDLFEEAGLEPPTTYEAVGKAIEALHNPPEMYGFVAATKVDETYMSQMLEHIFLANGVSPVKQDGSTGFEMEPTVEALEFYKALAEASPPGDLYWQQSRELYFAGHAAMIIWSPFILDELAGLRDSNPPTINDDPTSTELAGKTGVVTTLAGPANPDGAAWADIRYLGITMDADTDPASEFVKFSLSDGYEKTLSIAPEGKFPVRRGTEEEPDKYTKLWATLPVGVDRKAPLGELYPQEVVDKITSGLETAGRWGATENQLALASRIVNSNAINRLVREYLDGERDAEATVEAMNAAIADM